MENPIQPQNQIDVGEAIMNCINGYSSATNQIRIGFISQFNELINKVMNELALRGETIKNLQMETEKLKAELEEEKMKPIPVA